MTSNYKRIGDYIRQVKSKNKEGKYSELLGININKFFMPSVANTVGVNLKNYKIVKKGQFACNRMHVGRDYRIPIALSNKEVPFLVSPAYDVFELEKEDELLPEYLMMWFRRKEYDRNAWFHTDADVRGGLAWEAFCDLKLPIPSIQKQLEIVNEYNTITNRINLNEQLNQKLEDTAQALYKHWFVDFEFPNKEGKPYKSSGGEMVYNEELDREIPVGWSVVKLGEYIDTINGFAFKSSDFHESGKYPIIKIKNVIPPIVSVEDCQYFNEEIDDKLKRVLLENGDILITMTGSGVNQMNSAVGQVGKYYESEKALMNQRVCKLKIKQSEFKEFCYQFISKTETHIDLLNGSTGSANQANISPSQLQNLKFEFPDSIILNKYQFIADKIDAVKKITENKTLQELQSVLLSKMSKINC